MHIGRRLGHTRGPSRGLRLLGSAAALITIARTHGGQTYSCRAMRIVDGSYPGSFEPLIT